MALSGVRMADGKYADGSWELNITVTDMKTEDGSNELHVSVLVTSDLHIGGVIAKLVDTLKSQYGEFALEIVIVFNVVFFYLHTILILHIYLLKSILCYEAIV